MRGVPLIWRVFATNAAVLTIATLLLVLTPVTVSFPVALTELVVLAGGVGAMLALDLALLRRAFAPLRRLAATMRAVDPLQPGDRATLTGEDPEVAELTHAFNDMLDRLEFERRDSARRALAAQERERRRIARELHDEVGQVLTAVVLELDRAGVEEAREAVRASLEDVRGIARRLRPEVLDDLGLASALASLTNDVGRQADVEVERVLDLAGADLSDEEELVVYRVVQEALTNAVRHGGAHRVSVVVRAGEVVVSDDGAGFEVGQASDGSGLLGMRERAVLIGAALSVTSRRGEGTTVRMRLRAVNP